MQNTALIVEPRFLEKLPAIIENFQTVLGQTWKIVFYCGKGLASKWKSLVRDNVELRELEVNNFIDDEYSDFFKSRSLWESLYGDWVLTFQADTWLISSGGYTIDYFLKKNKSYIGGNMSYYWPEMSLYMNQPAIRNFNGGLSLRRREDMIQIINELPPQKTIKYTGRVENDPEDVYYSIGCYLLGLTIGDDEDCSHFAVSSILYDQCFGIHKPGKAIREYLFVLYPEIKNSYLPTGEDPIVPLVIPRLL